MLRAQCMPSTKVQAATKGCADVTPLLFEPTFRIGCRSRKPTQCGSAHRSEPKWSVHVLACVWITHPGTGHSRAGCSGPHRRTPNLVEDDSFVARRAVCPNVVVALRVGTWKSSSPNHSPRACPHFATTHDRHVWDCLCQMLGISPTATHATAQAGATLLALGG